MINDLKKFLNTKNPLFRFFLYLLVFSFISTFDLFVFSKPDQISQSILNLALIVFFAIGFYLFTRYKLNIQQANPLNFWVSSIIVYLLLHPTNSFYLFPLALVLVWIGKYVIKYKNLPIFNPAALGIFLTYYFTRAVSKIGLVDDFLLVSWWGADMQQKFLENIPLLNFVIPIVLLFTFIYFVDRFKKSLYIGSFFMTTIIGVFLFNIIQQSPAINTLNFVSTSLFNSIAFMVLVMVAEPKTSPIFTRQQTYVGIFGGLVFVTLVFVLPELISTSAGLPFITTILVMNIATFYLKKD